MHKILMLLNEEVIKCIQVSHKCKQINFTKVGQHFLTCSSHIKATEGQFLVNKCIVRSISNYSYYRIEQNPIYIVLNCNATLLRRCKMRHMEASISLKGIVHTKIAILSSFTLKKVKLLP